jgi:hypothetical protein
MTDIQILFAKKEEHKIRVGNEMMSFTIKQLDLDDIGMLDFKENASIEETAKNAIKLIALSLEGISEEEAKKIAVENMEPLVSKIMEVNNLDETKKSGMTKIGNIMQIRKDEKSNRQSEK